MSEEKVIVNPEVEEVEEISEAELSEQRQIRREKLKELQEAGRNPFENEDWDVNAYSESIKEDFEKRIGATTQDNEESIQRKWNDYKERVRRSF